MDIKEKVYIWLSISSLELYTIYEFLALFENIEDVYYIQNYEGEFTYVLNGQEFQDFIEIRNSGKLDAVIKELQKGKIKYTCFCNEDYPQVLKELDFPPFVIYYCGDISLLNTRGIAILGSRLCSRYGKEQTERFAGDLVKANFTIISGLSEGIEAYACEGALNSNGKVVGVLANGLNSIYPAINTELARRIVHSGGVLISEHYPDYKPLGFSFVQRNRLIAILAEAVLVTEAGAKSGSLHTVNFALDYGKEIFALPANCNSITSEGSNNLIKKYFCACVTSPNEIIEQLNSEMALKDEINKNQKPISNFERKLNMNEIEQSIYDLVEIEDRHFDELLEKIKIDTKKLVVVLTTMEIRGLIKKLPGNYFAKKDY